MNAADRRRLLPLFAGRRELRAVVDGVLDGGLGVAYADDAAQPRCARLEVGCYAILGGDASVESARGLALGAADAAPESPSAPGATGATGASGATATRAPRPAREVVFGGDEAWRALLTELHGARLVPRPMQEYDPTALDAAHLRRLAGVVPAGYEVVPLGARLASRLAARDGDALRPHALQVFPDAAAFAAQGLGFGALRDGALVCQASSYVIASGSLELAIATHPAHRGRGLGRALAARLALEALTRGLLPYWSASNPVSQRLALALGYAEAGVCEAYVLE